MRPSLLALLTFAGLTCSGSDTFAADPPAPIGVKVADFTLNDPVVGKSWSLAENAREAKATVIVFTSTGCPVCSAYWTRLADLRKRYAEEGVLFVAVNSQSIDTAEDVAKQAKEVKAPFPVLKDDGTKVADKFAIDRVPTALVLDATRTVRYSGRIDDQFSPGVHKLKPTTRELGAAIDAVIEGRDVKTPSTVAAGCKLTREKKVQPTAEVTYHKHVAAIVQAKCQQCHRPGEAGPFSLTSYKQTKGWADMIREVVADDIMPPWHADAPRGHFVNDRRLAPEEKKTLLAWVDAGCPEGDPKDAPPPAKFIDGWRLPKTPDRVIKMNTTVDVPASPLLGSGMAYQYIEAGEPFAEDTWVQAVELRPEYRAVVHHIIAYMIPDGDRTAINGRNFARHMLGTYVPGDQPTIYPEGMAKRIPKGTQIVFEVHYTPNGRAGKDRSELGIIFAKGPPKIEAKGDAAANMKFSIPPGEGNHKVTSEYKFAKDSTIFVMSPHMHLRGKAFKFELVTPDGKRETILNVPKYDFNWQEPYIPAEPLKVAAGTRLECTAWFDNSPKNPFNPDPRARVTWGNQTWEEMMVGFFEYYETK